MRRIATSFGVLLGLGLAIPSFCAAADLAGFRITARTDKESYKPGEHITIHLLAENNLGQSINIGGHLEYPGVRGEPGYSIFGTQAVFAWRALEAKGAPPYFSEPLKPVGYIPPLVPPLVEACGSGNPTSSFTKGLTFTPLNVPPQSNPTLVPIPGDSIPAISISPYTITPFARVDFDGICGGGNKKPLEGGEYIVFIMLERVESADRQIIVKPYTISALVKVIGSLEQPSGGQVQAPPETPWKSNLYTDPVQYAPLGGFNVGYQFIPQVDGKITKVGALIRGKGVVRLYDSSGSGLGGVLSVTMENTSAGFAYGSFSTPVAVSAGKTYTVAVLIAKDGTSQAAFQFLSGEPLPRTFGHINIVRSVYGYSDVMPTTPINPRYMYGQADIEFVPNQ